MTTAYPATSADGRLASAAALRFRRRPGCPEAWRRLQGSMEGLVRREAKRQYRADPGYDLDDLIAAGYDGVHAAALRFDRGRRKAFTSYAPHWIRQKITRRRVLMSEAVHVPANVRNAVRAWRKAGCPADPGMELMARLIDRPPSIDSREHTSEGRWGAVGRSSSRLGDPASESLGPAPVAESTDDSAWLRSTLGRVAEYDPRAVAILGRRFGLDGREETQAEIAASLSVSKTRVQQIESRAIRQIREMAADRGASRCA